MKISCTICNSNGRNYGIITANSSSTVMDVLDSLRLKDFEALAILKMI